MKKDRLCWGRVVLGFGVIIASVELESLPLSPTLTYLSRLAVVVGSWSWWLCGNSSGRWGTLRLDDGG